MNVSYIFYPIFLLYINFLLALWSTLYIYFRDNIFNWMSLCNLEERIFFNAFGQTAYKKNYKTVALKTMNM